MTSFTDLLQQSSAHAWLFIPSAILLGALHGLEPGHSKTMMAAFIVAIRGTVAQAVMLGVAATASHTLVVWVIAVGGMYLWQGVDAATFEPYFQLASGVVIVLIACWMIQRTWADRRRSTAAAAHHHHDHEHDHHHKHDHAHPHGHHHAGAPSDVETQDAHEREHADQIQRRFRDRKVTNWQIVMFGLTGGLIPCPAAITALLLCLQVKQFSLGFVLVMCFSLGLALTLVAVGAVAAVSVHHAGRRWSGFSTLARRAPYVSSLLVIAVGFYVGVQGWMGLI